MILGDTEFKTGTSCSVLKKSGIYKSGYYNIKAEGDNRPSLVFCDMTSETYDDVPEFDENIFGDLTPIGTILAWTPKPETTSTNVLDLPNGWMFCNGSDITEGPWQGHKTPDLNSNGAFLRGGSEDLVLEMEDSQLENHTHEDSGHSHTCSASSHSYPHHHTYKYEQSKIYAAGDTWKVINMNPYTDAYTENTTVKVTTTCSMTSEISGIGGVSSSANSGTETRPFNMKVLYVIRVY